MNPGTDAEELFGTEKGVYFQFDFYVEKHDRAPITPDEAYDLYWRLIHWLKEREYGFDGGAHLGNWGEEGEKLWDFVCSDCPTKFSRDGWKAGDECPDCAKGRVIRE